MAELLCPECGSPMVLRDSRFGPFYGCSTFPRCGGTHGAHPDGKPLGVPANKETKRARMRAHEEFDNLWRWGGMKRREAYRWLKTLPIPNHIGEMTVEDCERLIAEVKARMSDESGRGT